MSRVGIEFFGVDAGASAQTKKAIAQLEQLRAATAQTTKAAQTSAEAAAGAAETKVTALVEERTAIRANLLAYQQLAAASVKGSERQVAATQLATNAQRELGITAKATATGIATSSTAAAASLRKLLMPVLAIGAGATYMAYTFEESMQRLRTGAGATQAEVDSMSKAVLEMAHTAEGAGQSPVALAKALYMIESSGIRGAQALRVLSAASVNASTTGADLTEVTKALTSAVNVGISGAENETKAMGTLNAIVGAGKMTMEDLTAALSTGILPAAQNVGITLPQLGAALDTFTLAGVPAQQAATKMTATFLRMESPTGAAAKGLAALGIKSQDLALALQRGGLTAALAMLVKRYEATTKASGKVYATQQLMASFGRSRGGAAILALVQGWDTYNRSLKQVNKTSNDYKKNSKAAMETPAMKAKIAIASLKASLTEMGADTLPTVASAAEKLAKAISTVTSTFRGWGKVLVLIVGLAVAGKMVTLAKSIGGLAKIAVKAAVGLFRLAAGETAAGAGGVAAGAGANTAAVGMTRLAGSLKILIARLSLVVAGFVAVHEAVKKLSGAKNMGWDFSEAEGEGGAEVPVWDPKRKKWIDPATDEPMGKKGQKHWNEVAKQNPYMKKENAYTGRSTNPIVAKAQQLGVGSGAVYETGGGHGGAVKPGSVLDCSGYVYQIFTQSGFSGFPGTSETQWSTTSGPNWMSQRVKPSAAKPGDVVFMVGSPKYPPPGHVGIITSGSGMSAEVMQYYSTGKPAKTVRLADTGGLMGVKRFYLVKKSAKTTTPGGDTSYNPPAAATAKKKTTSTGADAEELKSTRSTARAIAKSVELVVSPTLRANLRKRIATLNKELEHVGSQKELTKLKGRATKIAAALKKALELNSVAKQLRKDTKSLMALVEKLPADARGPLAAKLSAILKATQDVTSKAMAARLKKQLAAIQAAYEKALEKLTQDVDDARDEFTAAWERFSDDALQAFDADTQKLVDDAEAAYEKIQTALEKARTAQDRSIEQSRAAEDKALADSRTAQDRAIEEQRTAEDRALAASRTAEDRATELARAAEDKALAASRTAEDKAIAKARTAEDKALQATRAAEDKALSAKYARLTQAEARLESMKTMKATSDAQTNVNDARRALEEAHKLRAGFGGTQTEIEQKIYEAEKALNDAIYAQEEQAVSDTAELERTSQDAAYQAEVDALQAQRDLEDQAIQDARDAQDQATQDARDAQDAAIEATRYAEDLALQASRDAYDLYIADLRYAEDLATQADRDAQDLAIAETRYYEDLALQDLRTLEDAAYAASLAAQLQAIEDQREALRASLEERLAMIGEQLLSDEPAVVAQGQAALRALMEDPAFAALFTNSGNTIGTAFATAFNTALGSVTTALNALIAALNALNVATGVPPVATVPTSPGDSGGGRQGYALGGKVPGLVARGDTVAARLTPGEYVIDRRLTAQLEDYLASGGGGVTLVLNLPSLLRGDERRVAKKLGAEMQSELDRIIRSRNRRG